MSTEFNILIITVPIFTIFGLVTGDYVLFIQTHSYSNLMNVSRVDDMKKMQLNQKQTNIEFVSASN